MEMQVIRYEDFMDAPVNSGRGNTRVTLTEGVSISEEEFKKKKNILREVMGPEYDICYGVATNVAACINMQTKQKYVNLDFLEEKRISFLEHAVNHEADHECNGMQECELSKHVSPEGLNALGEATGIADLGTIPLLLEGFTEIRTKKLRGSSHANTGYSLQIDVANALEKLSQEVLGVSLVDLFTKDTEQAFNSTLKNLTNVLLIRKALQTFARKGSSALSFFHSLGFPSSLIENFVLERFSSLAFDVTKHEDAEFVTSKLLEEMKSFILTQMFLGKNVANANTLLAPLKPLISLPLSRKPLPSFSLAA